MRETKLSLIKPSKIKVLTVPRSLLKLNRCAKDEYAITKDHRVLNVFESLSLSRHLALEGRRKIRWIRLVEKSMQHGAGAKRIFEIHFQYCDGRMFILDERDRLFSVNEVSWGRSLHSPCGLWGLVPEEPIIHMLLTSRMVDLIESQAMEGQIPQVLRTYWRDWSLTPGTSPHSTRTINIRGEFGCFKANYINSKMVKFDTSR